MRLYHIWFAALGIATAGTTAVRRQPVEWSGFAQTGLFSYYGPGATRIPSLFGDDNSFWGIRDNPYGQKHVAAVAVGINGRFLLWVWVTG